MGTIKIGSSSIQKGITIDPSIVLFNGNNVKKIMKDATTIWEDLKALIPTMTSNSMDGITLSASSVIKLVMVIHQAIGLILFLPAVQLLGLRLLFQNKSE